jgi:uncharacterized lipoprotein YmbA
MRRIVPLLFAALLGGCAATPGIPETTYYRLPPMPEVAQRESPLFEAPVVVETFLADGLHSDQALLYAMDEGAAQLRAYHYQLWVDPPVRMLQRRLMRALRHAGVAALVLDRIGSQGEAIRVNGRIERFERVPAGTGWLASVALGLRVDDASGRPLLVRRYREDVAAAGATVADSVRAFGEALDRIHAAFIADLETAAR